MHASKSPLARVFKTTARAPPARDLDTDASFRLIFAKDETFVIASSFRIISGERAIAGHLQTNAAAHGSSTDIFNMSMSGRMRELTLRFSVLDFVTSHGMLLDDTLIGVSPHIYIKEVNVQEPPT